MAHMQTKPSDRERIRTLSQFHKLRRIQQTIRAIAAPHKLGPLQAAILFLAWERDPKPIGQSELVILLDTRAPTLTVSLRLLAQQNLIVIKPRGVDGSMKRAILTSNGQKLAEQLLDEMTIALKIKHN